MHTYEWKTSQPTDCFEIDDLNVNMASAMLSLRHTSYIDTCHTLADASVIPWPMGQSNWGTTCSSYQYSTGYVCGDSVINYIDYQWPVVTDEY